MTPIDPEDPLESLLQRQTSEVLPDNGFTAGVLNRLPETSSRKAKTPRRLSLRTILIGAAALIAAMVLIRNNALPVEVNSSAGYFDLVHELEIFTTDQGVLLGLSILAFSFATLWYLDFSQDVTE